MPLDIPSLPAANQVLRYAKASYDVTRDGGGLGEHPVPSQLVPAGVAVLGYTVLNTTTFVALGSPGLSLHVGPINLSPNIDPTDSAAVSSLVYTTLQASVDGSYPITVEVQGDGYSDGALTIYVWYVL